MATFDDYLREMHLPVEKFDALPVDAQENYRVRYLKWLELKNQQPASGNTHLRWQQPWIDCTHFLLSCVFFPF